MIEISEMDLKRPVRLARNCINRLGLRPPIDVAAVARACGIPVLPQPLSRRLTGVDAFLAHRPSTGQWAIVVDANCHRRRQRFSIAHELGHYLLHRRLILAGQGLDHPKYEREANEFASELLMPPWEVEDAILSGRDLQAHFDVSLAALSIRLSELGYTRPLTPEEEELVTLANGGC